MMPLELDTFGEYLSVDTDAWLDDRSSVDEELTAQLVAYLETRDARYVDRESVAAWLATIADGEWAQGVTGIYGEDGPVSVSTCNEDTLLSDDVSFMFAHAGDHTLIVETGRGYFLHTPPYAVVRTFDGTDDAEVFSYASGYLGHLGADCGAELILDTPSRVWRNGGGDTWQLGDIIRRTDADDASTAYLACPDCGGKLGAMID